MRRSGRQRGQRGFSLVEVMVALIVICVGLLGIAKLEALMLSSSGTSRVRALVALQAASLADAMHADREFWDGGSPHWNPSGGTALSVTGSTVSGTSPSLSSPNADLQAALAAALPVADSSTPGDVCLGTLCNSAQLAGDDLAQWAVNLAGVLPNSSSQVTCSQVPVVLVVSCTISITWNENTVAANSQEAAAGPPAAFQQQTYTLVVEP
jgi:type IV pilus assembly protein PilV